MLTCCSIKTEPLPEGGKTLRIEGSATAEYEPVLSRAFDEALSGSDYLELRCERIREADHTFAALVCSAHRDAALRSKRLVILGALPKGVWKDFELTRRRRGCPFPDRTRCDFRGRGCSQAY